MTVPVLVLMLTATIVALTLSLRDHAGHAAAVDLAELRATHAAESLIASCTSTQGCTPPEPGRATACAAGNDGLRVTAEVAWDPALWTALSPVTATRVVAYDPALRSALAPLVTNALAPC